MELPAALYRYRGYSEDDLGSSDNRQRMELEIREALRGRAWFSTLSSQNDPFDTKPRFRPSAPWEITRYVEDMRRATREKYFPISQRKIDELIDGIGQDRKIAKANRRKALNSLTPSAKEAHDNILEHANICCFSTSPLDILMWSYYGRSHSSFCYELSLDKSMIYKDNLDILPIFYVEDRPLVRDTDIITYSSYCSGEIQFGPDLQDIVLEAKSHFDRAFLLTKSDHWKHEREWRAIGDINMKPGYQSVAPYKCSEIVLGCNASREFSEFIKKFVSGNVPVRRAVASRSEYSLSLRD
ncbi:MAG: hypothetical protein DI556_04775 [Rhodovulum sulfidophilum]|uniref:DUF2971 domain-containing protein n=1 Tax=Rhodovulum sulfidophilum TaxID=35806 RepID=A0A2W5NG91_RHOSU|nr:MAG: hypothetical protein DI556_04775 [Rhodovulum sulfidophilum]